MVVSIPILAPPPAPSPPTHYSLRISEDFAQKLRCATTSAKVELSSDGRPVALVIDGLGYSLIESKESQRIELASCANGQLVIEGCIDTRLALDHVDPGMMKERTQRAELQRSSRKTVQLEKLHPASTGSAVKRPKLGDLSRMMVGARSEENSSNIAASSLKDQVIHLLAIEDMTADCIALKLGCSPGDLSSVLPAITVPNGILCKLKPSCYPSVDVHHWPRYSARERQTVARKLGLSRAKEQQQQQLDNSALRPADATRLADERARQMMKSTRRRKK